MIIAKVHDVGMNMAEVECLKTTLESFFQTERVLIISASVELIFHNEGKSRCSYCGRLNNGAACDGCGAVV